MAKVAFMTVGVLKGPFGDPVVQGFWDRVPGVFTAAEASVGFFDRSRRDLETGSHSWGETLFPKFCEGIEDRGRLVTTLSVWDDLESVAAFAYQGAHGEAMARRREWIVADEFPTYVAWWVEDGHEPSFEEACERIEHLHEHGSNPHAFNFKEAFSPDGTPRTMDSTRVREKTRANS